MALITDINDAGASAQIIDARADLMQVTITGTWNGGTVNLQEYYDDDDTWNTIQSWTDNANDIIETVGNARYRFNTVHGGSAPVLKCNVKMDGWIPGA